MEEFGFCCGRQCPHRENDRRIIFLPSQQQLCEAYLTDGETEAVCPVSRLGIEELLQEAGITCVQHLTCVVASNAMSLPPDTSSSPPAHSHQWGCTWLERTQMRGHYRPACHRGAMTWRKRKREVMRILSSRKTRQAMGLSCVEGVCRAHLGTFLNFHCV